MKTNKRYAAAVLASLLGAAILTGVALAGNPHGTPPGHAKGQVSASVSASATVSNSVGVKSSATTRFNVHAAAGSSATKLYGNGKTAGQIAMQNGASASTDLYGPGNSQPHKASLCTGGKTHLVDVHALKAHGAAGSCASASASTSTATSASSSASVGSQAKGVGVGANASAGNKSQGAFTPPSSTKSGGGISSNGSVSGVAHAAHPVLGAANFTG
jgi:hypothetical protein